MLTAVQSAPQAAQSGAARAQRAPQGPAIALQAPPRHAAAPSASERGRPVTLQTSDRLVRVHWVASSMMLGMWLAGFQFPVFGGVMYVTWELHLVGWLFTFLAGGN
jgi:hypothetical protein